MYWNPIVMGGRRLGKTRVHTREVVSRRIQDSCDRAVLEMGQRPGLAHFAAARCWMVRARDTFPGIWRATREMSYDVGGVNRDRDEDAVACCLAAYLFRCDFEVPRLCEFDAWLVGLSEDDMQTCVAGEEGDMAALLATGPEGCGRMLDEIFEQGVA